ncbi:MAG: tetratricopeptide repeat protein [Alphaproteobacteria bacterium]
MARLVTAAALVMALCWPAGAQTPAETCRTGLGRTAVDACKAAIQSEPANIELRRALARAFSRNADYGGAAETYRDITLVAPQDPRGFYEYAAYLAFVRRYTDAVDPAEKAMALRPDNLPAYRLAAIVYSMVERPTDAFRVSLEAAKLGDSISMYEVAEYYADGTGTKVDPRRALEWMEKAAISGHVTAMDRMTEIYLDGKLGAPVDGKKAELWATRAYKARRE